MVYTWLLYIVHHALGVHVVLHTYGLNLLMVFMYVYILTTRREEAHTLNTPLPFKSMCGTQMPCTRCILGTWFTEDAVIGIVGW